jgi:hypothetical protein
VGYAIGTGETTLFYTASESERIFIIIEGESGSPITGYTLKITEAEQSDDADMLEDEDVTNVDEDEQSLDEDSVVVDQDTQRDEDISPDSDAVIVDEDTFGTDDDISVTDENELDVDSNDSDERSDDDLFVPSSKSSSGCSCSLI